MGIITQVKNLDSLGLTIHNAKIAFIVGPQNGLYPLYINIANKLVMMVICLYFLNLMGIGILLYNKQNRVTNGLIIYKELSENFHINSRI